MHSVSQAVGLRDGKMSNIRHRESTANTRQSTPDNQEPKTTNDSDIRQINRQHSRQPTIRQLSPKDIPDNRIRRSTNNIQQPIQEGHMHSKTSCKQITLHASFVKNSKPTTTDRKRHYIYFIDNLTLSFTSLNSTTRSRQDLFYLPIDDRRSTISIVIFLVCVNRIVAYSAQL